MRRQDLCAGPAKTRTCSPTRTSEDTINRTRLTIAAAAIAVTLPVLPASTTAPASPTPVAAAAAAPASPAHLYRPVVLPPTIPAAPTIRPAAAEPRPAALPAVAAAQVFRRRPTAPTVRGATAARAARPHRTIVTAWTLPSRYGDASTVVSAALAQVGKPYIRNAAGPYGFDCSGLVMTAYQHAGVALPHKADLIGQLGRPVPRAQWQPGTVIAYPGHVALYIGNNLMVEAAHPGTTVRVVPVRPGAGRWLLP